MAPAGLNRVLDRISRAAARSGRAAEAVTVVAVSKGRTATEIMQLYEIGHRDFGENRAGELVEKAAVLPEDITWHFIGSIQSRKAKLIAPVSNVVHSLDRPKLVKVFAEAEDSVVEDFLIQVNIAGEERKQGVTPEDTSELVESAARGGLHVTGLMLIPPLPETPEDSRGWFSRLVAVRDRVATPTRPLQVLSMGMTDDFEVAVEEGATVVRIGRAIFDG